MPNHRAGSEAAHGTSPLHDWLADGGQRFRFPAETAGSADRCMTSGGLLIAVPAEHPPDAPGVWIGKLIEGPTGSIAVA
jgi:hypothetical protein